MVCIKNEKVRKLNMKENIVSVKNEIVVNVSESQYNYCIGEFPDGSLKSYTVENNKIVHAWSLTQRERELYDNIAVDLFYVS